MSSEHAPQDLIQAAVEGRPDALEKLLLAFHEPLVKHITAGMPPDLLSFCSPEDIAQETYIVVAREIRTFLPPFNPHAFAAWLFKIADHRRSAMIQTQRAAKRGGGNARRWGLPGPDDDVINLLELLAIHTRTPSRSAARRETVELVRTALAKLRDAPRTAVTSHYIEGRPIADVAAAMNRTEGAVLMLCNRGLKRLRTLLDQSRPYPAPAPHSPPDGG
ncbi:MAG: hypothetical protein CHACPFDD_00265 [Phycisphaerae bacterium]|nr:hypothetical protein [Phycisphaerae bacterium]